MREIGTLEVLTRPRPHNTTYVKIMRAAAVDATLPSSSKVAVASKPRAAHGTTITLHDIFYNLPVRRRQLHEPMTIELIRRRLECIALLHPHVSVTLTNDTTGAVILQTKRATDSVKIFAQLFGRPKASCMRHVSISRDDIKIHGFIGVEPHSNTNIRV